MKSKNKSSVVRRNAHLLSELVEMVNARSRRAAMSHYLNSDMHIEMMLGGSLVDQCEKSQRELLRGDMAPRLDVCCCAGTFKSILTERPYITYQALELPGAEDDPEGEDACVDQEIDDATFAKLSKLAVDKLSKKLVTEYLCSSVEYYQLHETDARAQRNYYKALLRRFEAAAQYAKAIGSDSARLWLEAICLLLPKVQLECGVSIADGLNLDADCVTEAYEVAQRAQRALWVDEKLRKLPAAKHLRKTSKPRR